MRSVPRLVLVASLAAVAAAQSQDIYITNANVSFGVEFNTTAVVYSATADWFKADPAGDPAGVLFKTAWAYRLDNDTREYVINDGNNQATFLSVGAVGIGTWADVDARGKISATVTYLALPTAANAGVVVARMQITNISAAPVTLNLFHLADVDDCGASWTTNYATPGNNGHQIFSGSCTETVDHFAAGADRWEVGSYTGNPAGNIDLYTRLEDTALYDLANTPTQGGPYDMRGCYQWQNRVLAPGHSETFTVALAHETTACAFGFTRFGRGLGGAMGVPQLDSLGDANLGTSMSAVMSNVPNGALAVFVFGLGRANTAIGDLTMLVAQPSVNFIALTAGNAATQAFLIPTSTSFCGMNLVGEGFVYGDATSTSTTGLPVTHTAGGHWVLGIY